ncbi:hypothetical protein DL93DRAFT_1099856 [Clavulina sp. PMI_390]|nr:hypothetical protein DL93DRAFT_1099856 [Clavulina sp. PMI_390]
MCRNERDEGDAAPCGVYTLSKPLPNGSGSLGTESRMVVATIELPRPGNSLETFNHCITYNGVRSTIRDLFPPYYIRNMWHSRRIPAPFGSLAGWIKTKKVWYSDTGILNLLILIPPNLSYNGQLIDADGQLLARYDRNPFWFKESKPILRLCPRASNLNIEWVILGWVVQR